MYRVRQHDTHPPHHKGGARGNESPGLVVMLSYILTSAV